MVSRRTDGMLRCRPEYHKMRGGITRREGVLVLEVFPQYRNCLIETFRVIHHVPSMIVSKQLSTVVITYRHI